jgi:hypothetical protein
MARRHRGHRSGHRSRRGGFGGLALLLIAALIGGFFLVRSNPALAAKLPPEVRKAIDSVKVPTSIPQLQLPTGLPSIQLPGTAQPAAGPAQLGSQTKTSGCQAVNDLPDSGCTPGAVFPDATAEQICQSGYASSVRNVPDSEKDQVYAEYGIASHTEGQYEVDHLISLELGGSNDISNLWPESAEPRPGFHEKDKVENYLHDQVCSGQMSLAQAQQQIASDWVSVYNQLPN